ncbi:hypothetical protein [Streptomyces sp. NPDC094032]|uniref:hypothetical protein n=1 Tax=Streptomyces sp. NPDC094032 TaxID=3155308 RepID=UPI00332CA81B
MIVRITILVVFVLILLVIPTALWRRLVRDPWRQLLGQVQRQHHQAASKLARLVLDPAREVLPQVLPGRPEPSMDLPNSVTRWCAAFLVWMPVRILLVLLIPFALSLANELPRTEANPAPPPPAENPLSSLLSGSYQLLLWIAAPFVALFGDIDGWQDLREQAPGWWDLLWDRPGVALDHLAGPAFLICAIIGGVAVSRTTAFFGRDGQRSQRRRSLDDERLAEARFRPVGVLLSAATQAARAFLETETTPSLLDAPRMKTHRVERVIRKAWRTRNGRPRRHQRQELKLHGAKVVMALRLAEAQQDIDPGPALKEMTRILVTVAERYAEGKVGELLDHDDHALAGVDPAPDYEPLRIAGVFGAGVVGAVLASALELSELAQTLLAAGLAITMLFILFKKAARPMLDAFASFFGGP